MLEKSASELSDTRGGWRSSVFPEADVDAVAREAGSLRREKYPVRTCAVPPPKKLFGGFFKECSRFREDLYGLFNDGIIFHKYLPPSFDTP